MDLLSKCTSLLLYLHLTCFIIIKYDVVQSTNFCRECNDSLVGNNDCITWEQRHHLTKYMVSSSCDFGSGSICVAQFNWHNGEQRWRSAFACLDKSRHAEQDYLCKLRNTTELITYCCSDPSCVAATSSVKFVTCARCDDDEDDDRCDLHTLRPFSNRMYIGCGTSEDMSSCKIERISHSDLQSQPDRFRFSCIYLEHVTNSTNSSDFGDLSQTDVETNYMQQLEYCKLDNISDIKSKLKHKYCCTHNKCTDVMGTICYKCENDECINFTDENLMKCQLNEVCGVMRYRHDMVDNWQHRYGCFNLHVILGFNERYEIVDNCQGDRCNIPTKLCYKCHDYNKDPSLRCTGVARDNLTTTICQHDKQCAYSPLDTFGAIQAGCYSDCGRYNTSLGGQVVCCFGELCNEPITPPDIFTMDSIVFIVISLGTLSIVYVLYFGIFFSSRPMYCDQNYADSSHSNYTTQSEGQSALEDVPEVAVKHQFVLKPFFGGKKHSISKMTKQLQNVVTSSEHLDKAAPGFFG